MADLPDTIEGLVALARELTPELRVEEREGGRIVVGNEHGDELSIARAGRRWRFQLYLAPEPGGGASGDSGILDGEAMLACHLGMMAGLDYGTIGPGCADPVEYLRHRALVELGDPQTRAQEERIEEDERAAETSEGDDGD